MAGICACRHRRSQSEITPTCPRFASGSARQAARSAAISWKASQTALPPMPIRALAVSGSLRAKANSPHPEWLAPRTAADLQTGIPRTACGPSRGAGQSLHQQTIMIMKRRTFLKTAVTAAGLAGAGVAIQNATAADSAAVSNRGYYEIRSYTLNTPEKKALIARTFVMPQFPR